MRLIDRLDPRVWMKVEMIIFACVVNSELLIDAIVPLLYGMIKSMHG